MHAQSTSPKVLVSAITDSLRGFQRRRGERRSYAAESFAGVAAGAGPAAQSPSPPPRAPAGPVEPAGDTSPFRPCGYVEMNGRAIPVMDPVFLQALQAQVAEGMVPPSFLLADLMGPGARAAKATSADPQAAAAVHGATDPENMSAPPPSVTSASSGEHVAPKVEEIASASPGEHAAPRTEDGASKPPVASKPPEVKHASAAPEPGSTQMERLFERRADEEMTRLGALLREHEHRLAEQAEAAAKQQAALLREVLAAHRTEQAEQASRHAQVIRDLLREHQNQLDDRATAAVTREAQTIGTLHREHREALVDVHETHRRDLEEVLESHRDELQAGRAAQGGDDKFREHLAEQAKQQNAAHLQLTSGIAALTAVVQRLGERVEELADQTARQHVDLSWLPPPPSFVPPLPVVPTGPIASLSTPAIPEPPWPVQATGPSQSSAVTEDADVATVGDPAGQRGLGRDPKNASSPTAAAPKVVLERDLDRATLTASITERSTEQCLRPTT